MFVRALTLAAIAFAPVVLADGYLHGFPQALNESGLTQLANLTACLDRTPDGRQLADQLSQGNKTIFAPTNAALSSVDPAVINNETLLADIISYHVVSGNYLNETLTYPNVTIGRTLLNESTFVTLEGNKSQVLVWSKSDNGSFFVLNNGSNVTVVNTTSYEDNEILAIDSVLIPPPNMTAIFSNASYDLTAAAAVLQSTAILGGPSVYDALVSAHGVTVFAPNNAGVQAAQSSLASLSTNATALQNILSNHIINGTTVYSTELFSKSAIVSSGGQDYSFISNSTGLFVSVGGSNAVQIVQANVLTSNGVIHIVNGVMLDTNSNAALASSAFASATSVAAETGTVVGPVGTTGATDATSTATNTASPIPTPAGAVNDAPNNWKLGVLAGMVLGLM